MTAWQLGELSLALSTDRVTDRLQLLDSDVGSLLVTAGDADRVDTEQQRGQRQDTASLAHRHAQSIPAHASSRVRIKSEQILD